MWPSALEQQEGDIEQSSPRGFRNSQRTSIFDAEAAASRMSFYVGDGLLPHSPRVPDQWPGQSGTSRLSTSKQGKRASWMQDILRNPDDDGLPVWEGNFDVEKRRSFATRASGSWYEDSVGTEDYGLPKSREPLTQEQISKADSVDGLVSTEVLMYTFPGDGTADDPVLVSWMENDPANPLNFSKGKKWLNATILAIAVWTVSIASSGFSQGTSDIESEFDVDGIVALMLTSAFVLGFAVGALVLSPMSEVYGRRELYIWTYAGFVVLSGVIGLLRSAPLLILLRFLGGIAGSFTQAVAPAVIADMFTANERGFVLALFTLAGLMGQMLGPIFCGFLDAAFGWRSIAVFITGLAAPTWIAMTFTFPETYAPALLRHRAHKMEIILGKPHLVDGVGEEKTIMSQLKVGALRPWLLLFLEPIVALLSLFLSVVQGTMFLLFAAYPIVFQKTRGWHQGVASLPFLAVALGIVIALFYAALFDQKRYAKLVTKSPGRVPPEARLPPAMLGSVALPIGLFWFAWTNSPSTFWLISVSAGTFTGFGMVLLYMSLTNYIVDAYLGYAASALAATTVVRSIAAAVFPLFTTSMYNSLGIHWASSVPGFLSVAFVPCLLAFYKWGHIIRRKTRFAQEAARMAEAMSGGK
ncbi:hypothetical protein SLS53_008319 [Cytospora paraplurivora]|uniref:Major facilitator superfamily (MFS) profile domain-containing protein n=1 Tax=Cytospora paraplurivora TaxID=2898453 RepID=A0AAN9U7F7_9PEZI